MPKTRSAAIDAVRVVGIVAVIAGHVWSNDIARQLIYTWQVPIFFFLSGYLWSGGRSLATEARNRWRTLGVPYVFWLLLIGVAFCIWLAAMGNLSAETPLRLVAGGVHIGRPFSAFWFMSALFAACIMFRALERWPWVIASVGLVGLAATALFPERVASIPLSIGVAVPSLAFMVAGYGFRRWRQSVPTWTLLLAITIAGALIASRISAPLDMKRGDFGTPILSAVVAILICASVVLLAEITVSRLGAATGRAIVSLASCGTMVILTHAVVLWMLGTPPDGSGVDFLLALVIPWAAALAISLTPLAPVLNGTPRRQRVTASTG